MPNKLATPEIVSTGLPGLDEAIGGLKTGENVVWQINDLTDYVYVANRFVMHVARSGQRIVYFRFGEHDEIMDTEAMARGGANTKKYEIDPHIGFESFTVKVHRIIQEEGEGVFNGDIGLLEKINYAAGVMQIRFDDRTAEYPTNHLAELELAYAVTVHKSQGSEYPVVILPVVDCPPMLMYRNLLYTAVTRAKKLLIVVGSEEKLNAMARNVNQSKRYSALKAFLNEAAQNAGA